jgi:predicted permease
MPIWVELALRDVQYAVRGLLRNPAFTSTALLAAVLGTGATTAVFSVVDRVLFRPLPYRHERSLVSVGMMAPLDTNEFMFASEYIDLRRNPGPFEQVSAFQAGTIPCDLTEDNPLRLRCLRAGSDFLSTLGVSPSLGRWFSAEEDRPNGPRVAVISRALWTSRFGGDPAVLGRTVSLDGASAVILGVLPGDFETPTLTEADVYLPLALNEATERSGRAFRVFARLHAGISVPLAIAQLQPHFQRSLQEVPAQFRREISFRVRPVRDRQVGDVGAASLALFGAVVALLLLACANIANLLLARAAGRDREFAMRAALGASRWRLARQALTESLILALAGGAGGIALAAGLIRAFVAIAPGGLPYLEKASLDLRVLLFALAGATVCGLLFGLAPALRRPAANIAGSWRSTRPVSGGLRSALVTLQVAISLVLLAGAGLLLRTLWNLQSVPLGLETEHVLTARFVLGQQRYRRDPEQLAFFTELERRLAALPGVQASVISDSIPPTGGTRGRPLSTIEIEGRPRRPEGTGGMVAWRYVTPSYFRVLGIPIVRGRAFTEADRAHDSYAIILSETLVARLFPQGDALGRHMLRGPEGQWCTVVGIAGDVRNNGLAAAADPEFYVLRKPEPDFLFRNQEPPSGWRAATVAVRTPLDSGMMAASVRALIRSMDATVPVQVETMQQRLRAVTGRSRFNAVLVSAFAAIGVLLAATGLFGVLSFLVAQRRQEIAVRMALGADAPQVVTMTLSWAARWVLPGMLLGAAGGLAVARLLRTLLFQVPPADWRSIGAALAVLLVMAFWAAAGPARRAARLDPAEILRAD